MDNTLESALYAGQWKPTTKAEKELVRVVDMEARNWAEKMDLINRRRNARKRGKTDPHELSVSDLSKRIRHREKRAKYLMAKRLDLVDKVNGQQKLDLGI